MYPLCVRSSWPFISVIRVRIPGYGLGFQFLFDSVGFPLHTVCRVFLAFHLSYPGSNPVQVSMWIGFRPYMILWVSLYPLCVGFSSHLCNWASRPCLLFPGFFRLTSFSATQSFGGESLVSLSEMHINNIGTFQMPQNVKLWNVLLSL